MARVLIAHTENAVAQALAQHLEQDPEITHVYSAPSLTAAAALAERVRPEVAVVGVGSDVGGIVPFVRRLAAARPPTRAVLLLERVDSSWISRAVRAGARGVVSSDSSTADLTRAVRAVALGGAWLPPSVLGRVLDSLTSAEAPNQWEERVSRLSSREREVLDLIVAGMSGPTIAQQLTLSINTVRTHTKRILAKLEVHSTLEAASVARRASSGVPHD